LSPQRVAACDENQDDEGYAGFRHGASLWDQNLASLLDYGLFFIFLQGWSAEMPEQAAGLREAFHTYFFQ
jgi:hypothetical protein